MRFLTIASLINCLTSLALVGLVLRINPHARNKQNRSYAYFNVGIAVYCLFAFLWQISPTAQQAAIWLKFLFFSVALLNVLFLYFVFTFLDMFQKRWKEFFVLLALSAALLILDWNSALTGAVELRGGLGFWPLPTPLFKYGLLLWHASFFLGLYWLVRGFRVSEGLRRGQIQFIALSCAVGYIGVMVNALLLYHIPAPSALILLISVYVGMLAFAVVRYRLLDLDLVVRWGLAYSVTFLIVFSLFGAAVLVLDRVMSRFLFVNPGIPTIVAACVAVFFFNPIRKRINVFVDKFIFKSPDFKFIISGIDKTIDKSTGVESIAGGLIETFKTMWGVDHVGFVLWNQAESSFQPVPAHLFEAQILTSINETIGRDDFLVKTLESERRLFRFGIVMDDELAALENRAFPGERTTFLKIRRTLRWLGASVAAPLMLKEQLVGFIVLGPKKNNGVFTAEDKKLLSHVAEKVADAISKIMMTDGKLELGARGV